MKAVPLPKVTENSGKVGECFMATPQPLVKLTNKIIIFKIYLSVVIYDYHHYNLYTVDQEKYMFEFWSIFESRTAENMKGLN